MKYSPTTLYPQQLSVIVCVHGIRGGKQFKNSVKYCIESILIQNGDDCMVLPSVSNEDAAKMFPQHVVKEVPSGKKYMRITPQP